MCEIYIIIAKFCKVCIKIIICKSKKWVPIVKIIHYEQESLIMIGRSALVG